MLKILTIACLCVSLTRVCFSQELKAKSVLRQELLKAAIKEDQIFFNNKNEAKGIHFSIVTKSNMPEDDLHNHSIGTFRIKGDYQSLSIVGSSEAALLNGVYWYLNYLGFRYYFPGQQWEFIPKLKTPFKEISETITPSFEHRRIWYAYGTGSKVADKDYAKWFEANLQGGEEVNAGHAYDAIVKRNRAIFLQHPEYFAQRVSKGTIPVNPKFEVANEALVQLLIKDAFAQVLERRKNNKDAPIMISMDPSDGGGFSTSSASQKIGGPSEQVFYLANRVAKAVREKYPQVKVGLYAYNFHAAPPQFDIEPNIVVLIATALNQSAHRTEDLFDMWGKKGITLGVRDYYGVMAWDWDMPGQPKGSKISNVKKLRDYYEGGMRIFTAETNIGWISRGLGHYIAARLLWDVNTNVEKEVENFFTNMFGNAADDIRKLYNSWENNRQLIPLDGDIFHWIELINTASKKEYRNDVQQRLIQLKQYIYYVHLFKKWREDETDKNLVTLLNYAYRIQDDGIVASYPLFRRIANAAVEGKKNMKFNDPQAVWKKNNQRIGLEEIDRLIVQMTSSLNKEEKTSLVNFPEESQFEDKTAKKRTGSSGVQVNAAPVQLRGGHRIIINLNDPSTSINLSAGLIKAHQYKPLKLDIYPYNQLLNTDGEPSLLSITIEPRKPMKSISLDKLKVGTYIAVIDDSKNGFTLSFTGNVQYAIVASFQQKLWTFGRNNLYFNVKNEKSFTINNQGPLTLRSPVGRIIDMQKTTGITKVEVKGNEQGEWEIIKQSGVLSIQGVLPFVGADRNFLLKPIYSQ